MQLGDVVIVLYLSRGLSTAVESLDVSHRQFACDLLRCRPSVQIHKSTCLVTAIELCLSATEERLLSSKRLVDDVYKTNTGNLIRILEILVNAEKP